jgi:hypothetical protein
MAYNLKLEVFQISLKKKGGSNSDLKNYSEFFKDAYYEKDKVTAYKEFIKDYISSFNKQFELNKDKTKGISVPKTHEFVSRSEKNIIDGAVIGGQTGIPQDLFKQNNAVAPTGNVAFDDVTTLPYYIKIWTPLDHNTGILMVQSYSNLSVTDLVKMHLSKFFKNFSYSLVITPFVPKSIIEHFKKESNVYKVAFVKESLRKDKRKLLNPLFTEFDDLNIRIEVSGFKKTVNDFWEELMKDGKIIKANLEDFDIKENDDFKTIAYYVDSEGHRSNTSIERNLKIKPTIFLDNKLKKSKSEYFDFTKIKNHTDSILEEIKKELKYTQNVK